MATTSDGTIEALLVEAAQAIHDVRATCYFTAIGMIVLIYDHILTLPEEVQLIWTARPSIAKTLFIANRYLVPITQITTAIFWNHFNGDLPKASCQAVLTVSFVFGMCSTACANILVILRVISLWDRNYRVATLLALGFCVSFLTASSILISIIIETFHGFVFEPLVHSCIPTTISPRLPGVWASMMVFEVLVLLSVLSNALYRPRGRDSPLRRALYRDGIFFFASLSSLLCINLIFSIVAPSSLKLSSILFVWASGTIILNRSLLNMHRASVSQSRGNTSLRKTSTHTHTHSDGTKSLSAHVGGRMASTATVSSSTTRSGLSLDHEYDKGVIEEQGYEQHEHEIEELEHLGNVVGEDRTRRSRVRNIEEAWGIELGDRTRTQASTFGS